jgi:hypothetical protein
LDDLPPPPDSDENRDKSEEQPQLSQALSEILVAPDSPEDCPLGSPD